MNLAQETFPNRRRRFSLRIVTHAGILTFNLSTSPHGLTSTKLKRSPNAHNVPVASVLCLSPVTLLAQDLLTSEQLRTL